MAEEDERGIVAWRLSLGSHTGNQRNVQCRGFIKVVEGRNWEAVGKERKTGKEVRDEGDGKDLKETRRLVATLAGAE